MSDANIKMGIVGLGNIGFAYDQHSPSSYARTHASAAVLHPSVDLNWGVDPSLAAREGFQNKLGIPAFDNVNEAFNSASIDVAVLAVGLDYRQDLLPELLAAKPRVILCEKPLALTAAESNEIASSCADAGIELIVNYPRRFSSQTQRAKQLIDNGEIGALRSGHVWYGKGVANSGSHLLNLLIHLFGPDWKIDQVERVDFDYLDGDFDASFRMTNGDGSIRFTPLDVKTFDFAEIDLLFESGRLRFVNHAHSLVEQTGLSSAGFEGMSQLTDEVLIADESVKNYQLNVLKFIVERINTGAGFEAEVGDAISTADLVEKVLQRIVQK